MKLKSNDDAEQVATSSEAKIKRASLEKRVCGMREHIDDPDNRERRCNVCVIGEHRRVKSCEAFRKVGPRVHLNDYEGRPAEA